MWSWARMVLVGVAVAVAAAGCAENECGPGTQLRAGRCVAADQTIDGTGCTCGPFTHLDIAEGRCVLDYRPTVCGPGTHECVPDGGLPAVCTACVPGCE